MNRQLALLSSTFLLCMLGFNFGQYFFSIHLSSSLPVGRISLIVLGVSLGAVLSGAFGSLDFKLPFLVLGVVMFASLLLVRRLDVK